ncbi:hypothetical protein COLO4_08349 [Corchorus olitorius]|uniref:Uncharacterized protein n=1 Tax=Corchorus olitorius TaxID=93759 RepID=A0A1R3KGA5_9ROSI|nr:hypothetical protein COLO4_08349 [Corchorus olitorius]
MENQAPPPPIPSPPPPPAAIGIARPPPPPFAVHIPLPVWIALAPPIYTAILPLPPLPYLPRGTGVFHPLPPRGTGVFHPRPLFLPNLYQFHRPPYRPEFLPPPVHPALPPPVHPAPPPRPAGLPSWKKIPGAVPTSDDEE